MEKGFTRRSTSLFALFALCVAPVAAAAAEASLLRPQIMPVGRWAEGLVATSKAIWVAESGQRAIVEVDPDTGAARRRVKVGRLPVGMVLAPNGDVAALVQTDKLVWLQPLESGKGKALTGLVGCPNGIASGASNLWVLTEPNCSSLSSQLIRIEQARNQRALSPILSETAQALVVAGGSVWIAHGGAPALSIVDAKTLAARTLDIPGASLWAIAAANGRVFAGGRHGGDNARGLVVQIDPAAAEVRRVQDVDQRVAAVAADDRSVVAVGEKGRIWVFAADGLDLQRVIDLTSGEFHPRAAVIRDDRLLVASQEQDGRNGAVLALTGWRPQGGASR